MPHIGVGRVSFLPSLDISGHFLGSLTGAMPVIAARMICNNAARSNKLAAWKRAADMRRLVGYKSRLRIEALFACVTIKGSRRIIFRFSICWSKN